MRAFSAPGPVHLFKIEGMNISAKDFNSMPFGRQIEHHRKISEFKARAKKNHFSQKRCSFNKGLTEFKKLYGVKEFYTLNRNTANWKDDSVEIWYTD